MVGFILFLICMSFILILSRIISANYEVHKVVNKSPENKTDERHITHATRRTYNSTYNSMAEPHISEDNIDISLVTAEIPITAGYHERMMRFKEDTINELKNKYNILQANKAKTVLENTELKDNVNSLVETNKNLHAEIEMLKSKLKKYDLIKREYYS